MIEFEFTPAELRQAVIAGGERRIVSIMQRLNKNKHAEKSDWATDIDGCLAEMAVAKWKGWYWSAAVGTFKSPDVGPWQVRSTCHNNGHLIIRPNDVIDDEIFILAITQAPIVKLIGLTKCGLAKQDEYWRDDCWMVPQWKLREIN